MPPQPIPQTTQLSQLAQYLAHLTNQDSPLCNPTSPKLIINTLELLIPDASQYLKSLSEIPQQQQQWHHVISFIEENIVDEMICLKEQISTSEIIQVYHLMIQLVEKVTQNQEIELQQSEQRNNVRMENQQNQNTHNYEAYHSNNQSHQCDSSDEQNSNPTPSQLSSQSSINLHPLPKNQSQLDYIQNLKKSHQMKKQHQIMTKDKNKNQLINHRKKQTQIQTHEQSQQKTKSKKQKKQLKSQQQVKNKLKPKITQNKSNRDKITEQNTQKSKQKQFILSQSMMNQQYDQPFQSIAIQAVKQALQNKTKSIKNNLKTNVIMRDNATKQIMQKAMRTYKYQLKNKIKDEKTLSKKTGVTKPISKENQMKYFNQKQKQMESEIINQQLKYYYQLREKKLNYINHMHQLIQKLQKERYLNIQQQQRQQRKIQKQKLRQKIKQADHLFQENMKTVKQNYKNHKLTRNIQNQAQIKIMKQVQKNIKQKKSSELNMMKLLWQEEERKLDLIKKDEEKIKSKLQDIYRRNKV